MKKRTTAIINSQAFFPKKLITCPAVLKMKLAIAPTIPGKISPTFFPSPFNALPTPLPTPFNPLDNE